VNRDYSAADVNYWLHCLRLPDAEQRAHAAMILGLMGPEAQVAVPALVEALRDDDPRVRRVIIAALVEIGPAARAAVPALVITLQDRCELVRRRAAQELAEIGPAARPAVPALVEALGDPDAMVRRWSAYALGEIGGKAASAAPALIESLREPSMAMRAVVACALVKIGPAALPHLLPALEDQEPHVRRYVAAILGKCGGDVSSRQSALQTACQDADFSVRESALAALTQLWETGPVPAVLSPDLSPKV
jgi:HEAT repeat protein